MTKKVLAISGVLLAAIMAILTAKGDAISFAKKLKGTNIKAEPVAESERPIVLARSCSDQYWGKECYAGCPLFWYKFNPEEEIPGLN